jgi:hypothetical protein
MGWRRALASEAAEKIVAQENANLRERESWNSLIRGDWWARKDLNLGPMDYESTALTAELRARFFIFYGLVLNSVLFSARPC